MTFNTLKISTQSSRDRAVGVSSLKFMVGSEELHGVQTVMFGTPDKPHLDSESGFVHVTITCLAELPDE